MADFIEHTGIVESCGEQIVSVRIEQQVACAGCHAKNICSAAEKEDKVIEVFYAKNDIKKGDKVLLIGQSSLGLYAVLLAYVLPFLLILTTLFVTSIFVENELVSGTISLSMILPYYIVLSLNKKRLKKKFTFEIVKI